MGRRRVGLCLGHWGEHEMKDQDKTKEQPISELTELQQRSAESEALAFERREPETTLQREIDYAQSLIRASRVIVLVLDTEGRIVHFNPYMEEVSGYRLQEVQGKDWFTTFLPEQDWGHIRSIFRQALGGTPTQGNVNPILTKDGRTCEIEWSDTILKHADGSAIGLLSIGHDVTERKRAEQALRESEREKAMILSSVSELVTYQDDELRIVWANRAAGESVGLPADKLVGRHCYEIWPGRSEPCEGCPVLHALETGEPQEAEMATPDGRVWSIEGYPVRGGSGDVVGAVEVTLEITERKQGEQALRESEEKFRNLAEQSPNMIFINKAGKVVYASKRCEEVTGYTRDEFHAKDFDFLTLIAPDHRERAEASFGQHLVGQEVEPYEYTLVTKSGRRVEVIIFTRLIDYEGERAILGIATDITEHKRAAEEIQRRALEQETLREAALTLTTTLDRDEVIDRILAQLREVVPYDTASVQLLRDNRLEIVGGRGFPNMEELLGITFDPSQENNPNREVIRTRAPFIMEDAPTVYEEFLRDPHAAAGIHSWLGVPMVVGERLIGMLALDKSEPGFYTPEHARLTEGFAAQAAIAVENARLHQEVLDHAEQLERRVQERTAELQAQHARLGAILRSTTDGIVVADAQGNIVQINPVAQAWLTKNLSREDAKRLRDAVRELAQQAEELPEMVLELTGLDLELRAGPVVGEGTQEASAVVNVHDVSDLKALDRIKTVFIANVSHELRQPVSTIQSYVYLVQRTPPTDERWGEYLDSLAQEANRQTELVEDIMQISRIHAGQLKAHRRPTPLNELSEVVVASCRALAQERELTLEYCPLDPGPVASVDPKQITQVLNILMGDAVRYTPKGRQVVVSTGTEEAEGRSWATVTVSDMGEGIPAEDLPHIFERFFREEEPRSARVSETGLKLMIVKGIVELHGGRVTVESEQGVGSTFTVRLPLAS
jgi:PAS domain S-box-containing protein